MASSSLKVFEVIDVKHHAREIPLFLLTSFANLDQILFVEHRGYDIPSTLLGDEVVGNSSFGLPAFPHANSASPGRAGFIIRPILFHFRRVTNRRSPFRPDVR